MKKNIFEKVILSRKRTLDILVWAKVFSVRIVQDGTHTLLNLEYIFRNSDGYYSRVVISEVVQLTKKKCIFTVYTGLYKTQCDFRL